MNDIEISDIDKCEYCGDTYGRVKSFVIIRVFGGIAPNSFWCYKSPNGLHRFSGMQCGRVADIRDLKEYKEKFGEVNE
jgi:hypothetical protein